MNGIESRKKSDVALAGVFIIALGVAFVAAFVLQGCTVTHFNRAPDGSIDASNYSLGMDRKDLKLELEKNGARTVISVGESNASASMGKVQAGMATMLEGFEELNR